MMHYFNDLLPMPYTDESLRHVSDRVDVVQDFLGSRILVENLSAYIQFEASEMSEAEFINELVSRTRCGIMLDINNAPVKKFNHGCSAKAYVDSMLLEHVDEVHLAGFEHNTGFLIDAHNNRVSDQVWALFAYYLERSLGAPVLIEWDNDIPEFSALLDEAARSGRMISSVSDSRPACAIC
jgi:uncharacterized protein (UPF0276 family)